MKDVTKDPLHEKDQADFEMMEKLKRKKVWSDGRGIDKVGLSMSQVQCEVRERSVEGIDTNMLWREGRTISTSFMYKGSCLGGTCKDIR